ncbi:MAG: flagellar M-ring protein FliF [Caldithrix sp.]|nr:MAG: flagellar M-ring protein FliF [Caldithrix sp.]
MNSALILKIKQLISQLTPGQKIGFSALTVIAIICMFMILTWANRPEYGLLYSNLDASDVSNILDDLKGNGIPYKLKNGGTTVLVPKKDVYELRIKYAGKNMISTGAVGYELFDKNNLGLTDFMQKVNLKRALEGELANTINQIDAVMKARVHLVMPERALFEDEENQTTASVILKLRSRSALERQQVLGIQQLIAGSVEGLKTENIIIIDTFGNVLTNNESNDDEIGMSRSQYDLQQKVEKYLAKKAQSMLDKVLGVNNSIIQISVALNFEKIRRTTEKVDPENSAVLSEEKNEERSSSTDTTHFQRENSITNYELNKVTEQYENSVGDIKHLSIAVFVNGVTDVDQDGNQINVPRPVEEIQKITEIVKSSVGFQNDRNDQIVVNQLTFDQTTVNREKELLESIEQEENRNEIIKFALMGLGAILVLFMLRSFFKKLGLDEYMKRQRGQLLSSLESADKKQKMLTEDDADDYYNEKLSHEAKERLKLQEKITGDVTEFTQSEPARAANILQYWLYGDDE